MQYESLFRDVLSILIAAVGLVDAGTVVFISQLQYLSKLNCVLFLRLMLCVIKYIAKSIKVTQSH